MLAQPSQDRTTERWLFLGRGSTAILFQSGGERRQPVMGDGDWPIWGSSQVSVERDRGD